MTSCDLCDLLKMSMHSLWSLIKYETLLYILLRIIRQNKRLPDHPFYYRHPFCYRYAFIDGFFKTLFVKVFYILLWSSKCVLHFDVVIKLNIEAQYFYSISLSLSLSLYIYIYDRTFTSASIEMQRRIQDSVRNLRRIFLNSSISDV